MERMALGNEQMLSTARCVYGDARVRNIADALMIIETGSDFEVDVLADVLANVGEEHNASPDDIQLALNWMLN